MNPPNAQGPTSPNTVLLEISQIHDNPYQVRVLYEEDELRSLADSIRNYGVISPIIVRHHLTRPGVFQCISGHRRLRAAKIAGSKKIRAIIREASDEEMIEISVIENEQRSELNPIEKARGYRQLTRIGHTQQSVANLVGTSRGNIGNGLRLLEMDLFLQECVLCETLDPSNALLISTLPEEYEPYHLADLAMDWNLSRREIQCCLDKINDGSRQISWVRKVPVSKLWEYLKTVRDRNITECPNFDSEPLIVDPTGLLLDMRLSLMDLDKWNLVLVNAEIFYQVQYLEKRKTNLSTVKDLSPGLAPDMTETQRSKMKRLGERLSTHDRSYSGNIMILQSTASSKP